MGQNRVTVTIFGEQYVVKTSGSPAYIRKLAAVVDRRMTELSERNPQLGTSKIAVLCALSLADELVQSEQK